MTVLKLLKNLFYRHHRGSCSEENLHAGLNNEVLSHGHAIFYFC